jgi:glycosyltransferase involved in cell wall biosynthesis
MTTPRFSFLTTAYRTEHFVRGTIDSVVAQTSSDWELIVVDNGNSDAMAAIVREYHHDPRITLVRQENRGYVGGVMAAANHATGRYLAILDSDDQLMPTYCAEVGALLDSDAAIDAVGIDAHRFTNDGPDHLIGYLRSIGVKGRPDPRVRLEMVDVLGGVVPYYTAAVRRESWDAIGGFDSGVEGVDDSVAFWLRMVRKYDVRVLPTRLARYRLRSDSLSRDPASVENFETEFERAFTMVGPSTVDEELALDCTLRRIRYWKFLRQARTSLLAGDDRAARHSAVEAVAQRCSLRSLSVLVAVSLAPELLRRIHPVKQRAGSNLELRLSSSATRLR